MKNIPTVLYSYCISSVTPNIIPSYLTQETIDHCLQQAAVTAAGSVYKDGDLPCLENMVPNAMTSSSVAATLQAPLVNNNGAGTHTYPGGAPLDVPAPSNPLLVDKPSITTTSPPSIAPSQQLQQQQQPMVAAVMVPKPEFDQIGIADVDELQVSLLCTV